MLHSHVEDHHREDHRVAKIGNTIGIWVKVLHVLIDVVLEEIMSILDVVKHGDWANEDGVVRQVIKSRLVKPFVVYWCKYPIKLFHLRYPLPQ
jgi:hypothetical protein